MANDSIACDTGSDVQWIAMTSECDLTGQEMLSSLIGFSAAPTWLIGHFLILSFKGARRKGGQKQRVPSLVTWSLLPHCIADVTSFIGAIMTSQFFPQIVFAVVLLLVHASIATVMLIQHLLHNKTEYYDLNHDTIVKARSYTAKSCGCCPLPLCSLSVLFALVIVSSDVTASHDVGLMTSSTDLHMTKSSQAFPWWMVCGEILGGVACLGHWFASAYDVINVYRGSRRHLGREARGIVMMMVGNAAYLTTVFWRRKVPWLKALPWTLERAGLLGINTGMLLQLWRKGRRGRGLNDANAKESLLSSSSGSDVESQSDVLWDSRWRARLCVTSPSKNHFHKYEPVTPPFAGFRCLGEGRSPQPTNRNLAYSLLQSTNTSCSGTADQDTELESEAYPRGTELAAHHHQQGGQLRPLLPGTFVPTHLHHHNHHHRNHNLAHLSPLTPEESRHRVVQWVVKNAPDDDVTGHVNGHVVSGGRKRSGTFSKMRTEFQSVNADSYPEPRSRKNSAVF